MPLDALLTNAILMFFIPLWMLAGFADWLFHRHTDIAHTAGVKESLLHQLMIAEVGLPLLAGLFLEINALVLAFMIAGLVLHELTVWRDLRHAAPRRTILPGEQIVHSFQELIPLMLLAMVALLHWDQFRALVTLAPEAIFTLEWKREPLPPAVLGSLVMAALLLVIGPFVEELWRCMRASRTPR